jgi:hypothetical protein
MFLLYIKGLLAIIAFIGYPFLFNWVATKIFPNYDPMNNNYGAIGALFLPYVLTLAVLLILLMPLLIGQELFGG